VTDFNQYQNGSEVQQSGQYRCAACNYEQEYIEADSFGGCDNCGSSAEGWVKVG